MTVRQVTQVSFGVVLALSVSSVHAKESRASLQIAAGHETELAPLDQFEAPVRAEPVSVNRVMRSGSMTRVMRSERVELVGGALSGVIQSLDSSGAIHNLSDVTISFYRNGALAAQVLPGSDGVFTARLSPGFYTLVAYGPGGYCTYGLRAVNSGLPHEPPAEVRSAFQIESLAVPPSDFQATYMLSRKYAARSTIGPVPTLAEPDAAPLSMPPAEGSAPQTSLKRHTVALDPDGSVSGRLNLSNAQARGGMTAFLVRGGVVVKQATVNADGTFRFSVAAPGNYSFITAGPGGFSAFAVVITPPVRVHARTQYRSIPHLAGPKVVEFRSSNNQVRVLSSLHGN